jgi:hypothetical protein
MLSGGLMAVVTAALAIQWVTREAGSEFMALSVNALIEECVLIRHGNWIHITQHKLGVVQSVY